MQTSLGLVTQRVLRTFQLQLSLRSHVCIFIGSRGPRMKNRKRYFVPSTQYPVSCRVLVFEDLHFDRLRLNRGNNTCRPYTALQFRSISIVCGRKATNELSKMHTYGWALTRRIQTKLVSDRTVNSKFLTGSNVRKKKLKKTTTTITNEMKTNLNKRASRENRKASHCKNVM